MIMPQEYEPNWKLALAISFISNLVLFVIAGNIVESLIPLPSITQGWDVVYFQRNLLVTVIMGISLTVSGLFVLSEYLSGRDEENKSGN